MAALKGFEKEVGGVRHVVEVLGGGAALQKSRSGRPLLRIKIAADVGGVGGEYVITYGRGGKAAVGRAHAKAGAPGGSAERLATVVKALTGIMPEVRRMKNGRIMIACSREHLAGFARYRELAKYVVAWTII